MQTHTAMWTPPPAATDQGRMRIWHVNFVVTRRALRGSFQIYTFIGDFPTDWNAWASEPHLVSVDGIFTTTEDEVDGVGTVCANGALQEASRQGYPDFVPLTKMLIDYNRSQDRQPRGAAGMILESLEPKDVVPFSRRNVHWRVVGVSTLTSSGGGFTDVVTVERAC